MKILIVDDQPTNLKLLQAQLQAEGHTVIAAANGVEALVALEQEKVDAIISDVLMPQMDGFRLCYEVRKSPRLQAIPFIFYTASYISVGDEKLCLELGGDNYLRKPGSLEQIITALRESTIAAGRRPLNRVESLSETDVMQLYNARLVSKLEEQHIELQQSREKLQVAHDAILELNRNLERRIEERTDELEAANKELEAFSYSISHDLRAPLRAINGFARMFQEYYAAQLPEGASEKLEQIRNSATYMGQLIDGLLTFSKLGRQTLSKRNLSPATIVERVLEKLEVESDGRKADVSIADMPDCQGDPMLLQQVFMNLLSNALKYSRHRDPAVVEIGSRDDHGDCVYFVRDNGAGFDMRYSARLFQVFQRLHGSDEFEGIGVGLSIVQRIIQRHGGRIWAEAALDKGATFYFTLPG